MKHTIRFVVLPVVAVLICGLGGQLTSAQAQVPHPVWAQPVGQPLHYIPPWTGGDREYKGHGPHVKWSVYLRVNPLNPFEIQACVWMDAVETKRDWTRAAGTSEWKTIAVSPIPIRQIPPPTSYTDSYTDTNILWDPQPIQGVGFLRQVSIFGDGKGNDAGIHTGIVIQFNAIHVR